MSELVAPFGVGDEIPKEIARCGACHETFSHGDTVVVGKSSVGGDENGRVLAHRRCVWKGMEIVASLRVRNEKGPSGLSDRLRKEREDQKMKQVERRARQADRRAKSNKNKGREPRQGEAK